MRPLADRVDRVLDIRRLLLLLRWLLWLRRRLRCRELSVFSARRSLSLNRLLFLDLGVLDLMTRAGVLRDALAYSLAEVLLRVR